MTDYNWIAEKWDRTRQSAWGEFEFFRANIPRGARILDAGCGNGRLVKFLDALKISYEYLGVDNSRELLRLARRNFPAQRFEYCDLTKLRLPKKFDVIFCIAVLHHFLTREKQIVVLKNLRRALKPGGRLFLTTWNLFQPRYLPRVLQSLVSASETLPSLNCFVPFDNQIERVIHTFTKTELKNLCEEAGFHDVEIFYTAHAEKTDAIRGRNLLVRARG